MIKMPAENKMHEYLNATLTEQANSACKVAQSAIDCVGSGDYFQAAVRLASIGYQYSKTEWELFEMMSGEEGPLSRQEGENG